MRTIVTAVALAVAAAVINPGLSAAAPMRCKAVTVIGWSGPETKVRWDKTSIPGVKTPTTIWMKHRIRLKMCVPKNSDARLNQVVGIKDACSASAWAAYTVAGSSGAITALEACVETTEAFSQLLVKGVTLETYEDKRW